MDSVPRLKPSTSSPIMSPRLDETRLDLKIRANPSTNHSKRVVIIGGGYAGSKAASKLGKEFPTWEIVLIDSKDYFENTIAVLTTVTHVDIPSSVSAAMKIVLKHEHYLSKNTRFIKELVKEVTPTKVILESETIYYDYLIISCGTSYKSSIKSANLTSDFRVQALSRDALDLSTAETVLIVGGGLVGVELAGEICAKYPNKKITLATAGDRLLERMKPNVSAAAYKWLSSHGVEIILNERVRQSKKDPTIFRFSDPSKDFRPSKAYWCTGFSPNNGLLLKHFPNSIAANGYVKVNKFLQLQGSQDDGSPSNTTGSSVPSSPREFLVPEENPYYSNIFVIGDLADLPEEKMAERAWAHAAYVIKQIKQLQKSNVLTKPYKSPKKPPIIIISLGPECALMCTNRNLTTQGKVASSMKKYTLRLMMMKQIKHLEAIMKARTVGNAQTRLSIDPTQFTNPDNKTVALLGYNSMAADIGNLLSSLGSQVNFITSKDVDKNQVDALCKRNHRIAGLTIDPKIPNSTALALRDTPLLILPIHLSIDFLEQLEPLIEPIANKVKEGVLKRLLVVHPGYQIEKAGKRSNLAKNIRKLEEMVQDIHPNLKIIIVRYAPSFEFVSLSAAAVRAESVLRFPIPHQGIPFIASEDIKDTVAKIIQNPSEHDDQIYSICGDIRLTGEAFACAIGNSIDKKVKFEEAPSSGLMAPLARAANQKTAEAFIEWWSKPKFLTKQTDDLETVLGKASILIQDWSLLHSHLYTI